LGSDSLLAAYFVILIVTFFLAMPLNVAELGFFSQSDVAKITSIENSL
jgi:hypothetical protein